LKPINVVSAFLFLFLATSATFSQNPSTLQAVKKSKILINIKQCPENPTRAALGFLIAGTALEEGHTADIFLAGDAVKLMQDTVLNSLTDLGTGKLRDHDDDIVKYNGKFYLSGNSGKARGVT
jgi:uncharacterized protein